MDISHKESFCSWAYMNYLSLAPWYPSMRFICFKSHLIIIMHIIIFVIFLSQYLHCKPKSLGKANKWNMYKTGVFIFYKLSSGLNSSFWRYLSVCLSVCLPVCLTFGSFFYNNLGSLRVTVRAYNPSILGCWGKRITCSSPAWIIKQLSWLLSQSKK